MIRRRHLAITCALAVPTACLPLSRTPHAAPTPRARADAPRFEEIARAAGIDRALGHAGKSPLTIRETAPGGGAFVDFDADGWPDILLVAERRLWLFRNDGHAHFQDVSRETGLAALAPESSTAPPGHAPVWMGCAVGDPDNDGFPDLYVTGYRCSLLLRNDRGKRFRESAAAAGVRNDSHWETSAVFFDADRDGREDLYVGRYLRFGPGDRAVCDFRGVAAACPPHYYAPERGKFFRNDGAGRFSDRTRDAGFDAAHGKTLGVATIDSDSDGRPELYLANDGAPGDHFRPGPSGRFDEVGTEEGTAFTAEGQPHAGMGADWGDVNNDLRPDLVVTAFQHEGVTLFVDDGGLGYSERGEESGLRSATQRHLGFGAKFADFDNDGRLDLLLANGHVQDTVARLDETARFAQTPQLFRGDGHARFVDVSASAGPSFQQPMVGRAVSVSDFDNDGRLDALVVDAEGPLRLLHNRSGEGGPRANHWLGFRLIGRRSPRSGSGAIVTVETGKVRLRRDAGTGGSYLAASDPRVHFGLGDAARVQRVTIHWPSGAIDQGKQIATDRWYTVEEGRGIAPK